MRHDSKPFLKYKKCKTSRTNEFSILSYQGQGEIKRKIKKKKKKRVEK